MNNTIWKHVFSSRRTQLIWHRRLQCKSKVRSQENNTWNNKRIVDCFSASIQRITHIVTSTPHRADKPRVNFHSVESLAISSSVNTSSSFSLQPHGKSPFYKERSLISIKSVSNMLNSSLITFHRDETLTSISRLDDTGYNSLNSSTSINEHQSSTTTSTSERKVRLMNLCDRLIYWFVCF